LDRFHLAVVCAKASRGKNVTQESNSVHSKDALCRVSTQAETPKASEDFAQVVHVVIQRLGVDKNIVEITDRTITVG